MSAGADNTVRNLDINALGNVLASGDFTRIGSADANGLALWNGSTWVNLDVDTNSACYAARWDRNGENIFIAPNATIADYASITTFNVKGTAEVNPVLYIAGPCTLRWLENQTTKRRIYANLDILSGEEVIFDFGNGKVQSTIRADLSYAILPGSDIREWKLLPGENRISALMMNDVGAVMRFYYAPRYWSVDAMVDGGGL
jgi:hypothetical protein